MISLNIQDVKMLEMHKVIARKIRKHPELLTQALELVFIWRRNSAWHFKYLDEWLGILESDMDKCLGIIIENSVHATELRRESPLTNILTMDEQIPIIEKYSKHP